MFPLNFVKIGSVAFSKFQITKLTNNEDKKTTYVAKTTKS